jgi:GTPase SAR1 family protein
MENKFINLFLIGKSGTGKSTFASIKKNNNDNILNPTGIDVVSTNFYHNFEKINITFYKINNSININRISKSYIECSNAILLFCDLSDESSFNYLYSLLPLLKKFNDKMIFLIGNKCDKDNKVISLEKCHDFCKQNNFIFIENSNYKSDIYNTNIHKILNYLIIENIIILKKSSNLKLKRDRSCSCNFFNF